MKTKKGFTFIEVTLFLAITGAIFATIVNGISNSIARRRYNEAVYDVLEQVRNSYASVISVENVRAKTDDSSFYCTIASAFQNNSWTAGVDADPSSTDNYPGRTRCAVYGQVVTFGEKDGNDVNRYDIIGLADVGERNDWDPKVNDDIIESLKAVKADIVTIRQTYDNSPYCYATLAGNSTTFKPEHGVIIEKTATRNRLKGAIVIVRSPVSGTIHTYFYASSGNVNGQSNETFEVQKWLDSSITKDCSYFRNDSEGFLVRAMKYGQLKYTEDLDICVGSDDLYAVGDQRRAIRIHGDGSTESSVELLSESDSVGICKKK